MLRFLTRPPLTARPAQCSPDASWGVGESCVRERTHKENAMPERNPLRDSPRRCVSPATAQHFLRQIWRELQEWTLTAVNSAQMMATAIMNVLVLSVVAVFAALAVFILIIRARVMEKPPAFGVTAPAQLQPLTGEQADRLT